MSYQTALNGLHTLLKTTGVPVLLDYEPTAIHQTPTLYSLLVGGTRERQGQLVAVRFRVLNRLCVRWQDNEFAERELIPYVNSIPQALDADAQLGGAITSGLASITELEAVFVSIGGTIYRALDIYVDILEKAPVGSI